MRTPQGGPLGGTLTVPVGPEWDHDLDNGFRPAGLSRMSEILVAGPATLKDFGDRPTGVNPATFNPPLQKLPEYVPGSATHSITMYRASRKSLVFSSGTGTWSWGFKEGLTKPVGNPAVPTLTQDEAVKQATVNMLADMGAMPSGPSIDPFVVKTSYAPSSDKTPPKSRVLTRANTSGNTWSFSGSAEDLGGGRVVNVEVSSDGGQFWHRATLQQDPAASVQWVYTFTSSVTPILLARAVDDSYNIEAVKVVRDETTSTHSVYVFGGLGFSAGDSTNSNIEIKKAASGTFTYKNNGIDIPRVTLKLNTSGQIVWDETTFSSNAPTNITVQLAIGQNTITVIDDGPIAVPTISGNLTVRGGIGKDTFSADGINVLGAFQFVGRTGADSVTLTNSIVSGQAVVDALLNGNAKPASTLVGASITLEHNNFGSTLVVNSGNANDPRDDEKHNRRRNTHCQHSRGE